MKEDKGIVPEPDQGGLFGILRAMTLLRSFETSFEVGYLKLLGKQ